MDASDIRRAGAAVADSLAARIDHDWTVAVPHLTWTVAETIGHLAETLLWYSIDLAAAGVELEALQPSVRTDAPPTQLAATVPGLAGLLAHVVTAASPETRGFHPAGMADPSGFAAMGCDELLVHGWDAAQGLGADFTPDERMTAPVLHRLFPWDPTSPIRGQRSCGRMAAWTCRRSPALPTGGGTALPSTNGTGRSPIERRNRRLRRTSAPRLRHRGWRR